MNALRKLYKELTSLHWEIGFLDNTFEGIVRGDIWGTERNVY